MIGTKACHENRGLPATTSGYSTALAHHCSVMPAVAPERPMTSTIQGSLVDDSPMALSRPCTGNGVWASQRV